MPPWMVLWWRAHWHSVVLVTATVFVIAMTALALWSMSRKAAKLETKVAVAEGQTAVASTNDANKGAALTASAERHRVEVTIREIERETGNVVAEARVTGDVNGAIDAWATGIDRMRSLDEAGTDAGPNERPGVSR